MPPHALHGLVESSVHSDFDLNADWRREVGASWPIVVALLGLGCAIAGFLFPLIDPDLPMHLRTAEWMLHEGRVPFIEPFSWTRPGAPFFAYSWLAELLYLKSFAAFGATGLHLVHACTAAGAFLTVVALGRASRWTPWATLLIALLSFAVWISFIGAVRPQALMGVTVPLSWLGAEWMVRGRQRAGLALTLVAAVLTVNTHVLFPVTAMPVLRFLVESQPRWRLALVFCAANAVGWVMTPYAFVFVDMMRINFTGNALIGPATSVTELEAGWKAFMHTAISIRIAAIILLIAPFAVPSRLITDRERFVYGLAWAAGAFLFGTAVRGIVIWLLAALPLLARAAAAIPLPELERTRRINRWATMLVPLGLIGGGIRRDDMLPVVTATMATRQLPVPAAAVMEPLVRFVECSLKPPAGTHAYTSFNYGSYLVWRLPTLSYSIDGRNIYPDSVAVAEAFQVANDGPMQLGPWRSADVAIAPLKHATAHAINASAQWQLLRVSVPVDTTERAAGLWVKRSWAQQHAVMIAMTADTVKANRTIDVPANCAATQR